MKRRDEMQYLIQTCARIKYGQYRKCHGDSNVDILRYILSYNFLIEGLTDAIRGYITSFPLSYSTAVIKRPVAQISINVRQTCNRQSNTFDDFSD